LINGRLKQNNEAMSHIFPENNENEGSKKIILRKIPLFDLMKLMEHLYHTGADYVDIVGISMGENTQDEIMIAVKDEYMSDKKDYGDGGDDDDDDDDEIPLNIMEGIANIVDRNDEGDDEVYGPEGKIQAIITEKDINDLLDI
jgi:hypothetical protein